MRVFIIQPEFWSNKHRWIRLVCVCGFPLAINKSEGNDSLDQICDFVNGYWMTRIFCWHTIWKQSYTIEPLIIELMIDFILMIIIKFNINVIII